MDSLKKTQGSWTQQKTRAEMQKKRTRNLSKKDKTREMKAAFPTEAPRTSMEFERDWRRHCAGEGKTGSDRYRYLKLVSPSVARSIWGTEIDATVMGCVIDTVAYAVSEVTEEIDVGVALDWMKVMTECGRFELNVKFLEEGQGEAAGRIFDWAEGEEGGGRGRELRGKYE